MATFTPNAISNNRPPFEDDRLEVKKHPLPVFLDISFLLRVGLQQLPPTPSWLGDTPDSPESSGTPTRKRHATPEMQELGRKVHMQRKILRMLGMLFALTLAALFSPPSALADGPIGERSENTYLTHMRKVSPTEYEQRFNGLIETNYLLETANEQGRPQKYIGFCFNKKKRDPHLAHYDKTYANATEEQFRQLAEDPMEGNFRNAVMWAIRLGYPGKQGGFETRAVDFYHIPQDHAQDAVHIATQMAIWLFTDQREALDTFWSPVGGGPGDPGRIKTCEHFDKGMGDPITYLAADIATKALENSKTAPDGMELDLYTPTYSSARQNFLVTRYHEEKAPEYGKLEITKQVKGANVDPYQSFDFTLTLKDATGAALKGTFGGISLDDKGTATVQVSQEKPLLIEELPAGSRFTVTEAPSQDWAVNTQTIEGTIARDQTQTAHFTNTKIDLGELVIQKSIMGTAASSSDTFEIQVSLTKDGMPLPDASYRVRWSDGTEKDVAVRDGIMQLSITGAGHATISQLPEGVECTASEKKADGSYTSTEDSAVDNGYTLADIAGNGVVTASSKPMKISITNRKDMPTASLSISKAIEGEGASNDDEFDFRITLKNPDGTPLTGTFADQNGNLVTPDADGTALVRVRGGFSGLLPFIKISGLPLGTQYSIEESACIEAEYTAVPGTAVHRDYVLKGVENGAATGVIGTKKNSVTFRNAKTNASLTIKKTIVGTDHSEDTFTFDIALDGSGEAFTGIRNGIEFQNGRAAVQITGSGSKTISGLPSCDFTVAERPLDGWVVPGPQSGKLSNGSESTVAFENKVEEKPAPTETVSVVKRWVTDDGRKPTDSVTVDLLRDGEVAETTTLNAACNWRHEWSGLEGGHAWTVEERDVPEGFMSSVTGEDGTFTIVNDDIAPDKPVEPEPEQPNKPSKPDKPTTPEKPSIPEKPTTPSSPSELPRTGDPNGGLGFLAASTGMACSLMAYAISHRKRMSEK